MIDRLHIEANFYRDTRLGTKTWCVDIADRYMPSASCEYVLRATRLDELALGVTWATFDYGRLWQQQATRFMPPDILGPAIQLINAWTHEIPVNMVQSIWELQQSQPIPPPAMARFGYSGRGQWS